jgi:hypothetical protein
MTISLSGFSYAPVHDCFFSKFRAITRLSPTYRQALRVSCDGEFRDFGMIDSLHDVTTEDARIAERESRSGNKLPKLAILRAFQGFILRRVHHLWTDGVDRGWYVRMAGFAVSRACHPPRLKARGRLLPSSAYPWLRETKAPFPIHALSSIRQYLDRKHKESRFYLRLPITDEIQRNRIHQAVMNLKAKSVIFDREAKVAYALDLPYLRVVQYLSLRGLANPDGAVHESDHRYTRYYASNNIDPRDNLYFGR